MRCDGTTPINVSQVNTIMSTYIPAIELLVNDASTTCDSGWISVFEDVLDYSVYINTSQDNFIAELVADTNQALIQWSITNGCSFYAPALPMPSLAQQIETLARTQIESTCYESCAVEAYIGT
jgi:hypothetical protein